jgi:hypothetical protein
VLLGEEHPLTLAWMSNQAAVLMEQKHTLEASKVLERTLDLCRRVLGPTHPETFKSAFHLVVALVRMNDSSGRVREVVVRDLSPLLARDPSSLPADLREVRAKLPPLLSSIARKGEQPDCTPWWRSLF